MSSLAFQRSFGTFYGRPSELNIKASKAPLRKSPFGSCRVGGASLSRLACTRLVCTWARQTGKSASSGGCDPSGSRLDVHIMSFGCLGNPPG